MFPIKTLFGLVKVTATVVATAVPVAYGAYKVMEGTEIGLRALGRAISGKAKKEVRQVAQAA